MAKKYIDAELLRKEIERHLERATAEQDKFPDMPKYRWYLREGKKELCTDLLDYMYDVLGVEEPITDSLQQEPSCDTCTNDKGCVTCKDGELWEGKEQQEVDLEDLNAEIEMQWNSFNKHLAEYGGESEEVVWLNWNSFVDIANYFYKLGKTSK